MFWKKVYSDFVDLTVGRVYIKPLTNGIINTVNSRATIFNNVLNNNLYFQLMEYKLVNLSRRKINKLTPDDGLKLRNKIKEILKRHGLITEEKQQNQEEPQDLWKKRDVEWFQNQQTEQLNKIKNGNSR